MLKIVVVGSLNMDLVITTPKLPVIGETILGSGFMTAPGGKGANQAVAAARLGGVVTMIGCVGNDIFGRSLLENLVSSNVSTASVRVMEDIPTGAAVIVVSNGNNSIIVDPGANSLLSQGMIEQNEPVIKSSDILVVQLEIPLETAEKSIDTAKRLGVRVLLNPAPAQKLSDSLLKSVDIITPNETECEIITGISIKSVRDAERAVEYLRGKGVNQVVITMGGKGVVYNRDSEIIHKAAHKVKAVDSTAAGDSFTGALAVALSQGRDIDASIDFANIAAALAVTKKGAQPSLPFLEDVIRGFEKISGEDQDENE